MSYKSAVSAQDARGRRRRSLTGHRSSTLVTIGMVAVLAYCLLPLAWMLINSTKTESALFSSFGLWFSGPFALFDNIAATLTYQDGVYLSWFLNTVIYVALGAGGATIFAALGGYGLAKFNFRGKNVVFAIIIGSIAVPGAALAVPLFLLFTELGLLNTVWAIVVPALASPFGLYVMWAFTSEAIPNELIEAGRVYGAGEFRIFWSIVLRLLAPGTVTVFLLSVAGVWNNFFLPLIVLTDPRMYPLTVGLNMWNQQAETVNAERVYDLVITGSLLAVIPVIIVFLVFQRYWQASLTTGSGK